MGVGERVGPLEPAREYRPALSGGNGDTNPPKTIHPTSAHLLCALGEGWGPSLGFSSPSSNTCRVDRNAKPFSFSERLLNIYASPSGVPPLPVISVFVTLLSMKQLPRPSRPTSFRRVRCHTVSGTSQKAKNYWGPIVTRAWRSFFMLDIQSFKRGVTRVSFNPTLKLPHSQNRHSHYHGWTRDKGSSP